MWDCGPNTDTQMRLHTGQATAYMGLTVAHVIDMAYTGLFSLTRVARDA